MTIDKTLKVKDHAVNSVRAASFAILKIGRLSDRRPIERLVHAFVSSRLHDLPDYHTTKLRF